MPIKISIITICFNSASTIEETIKSVIEQDYQNLEYIVVDGGSTDGTLDILKKYPEKISKVISEKDRGIYDAMNKGISIATGDLIGILNSDDVYAHESVLSKIAALYDSEKPDAVYADLVYVSKDNLNHVIRNWKSGLYKTGLFLKGWMPPHPTFFVKKECYEKFGTYNISFRSAADYELMLRLIHKEKIKTAYLPETIIKMRAGGISNITFLNRLRANMEDRRAWKVNGLNPGTFTLLMKPLSKVFQFVK
jgi:glycosyltransferase involved in cell wall biosynthesis